MEERIAVLIATANLVREGGGRRPVVSPNVELGRGALKDIRAGLEAVKKIGAGVVVKRTLIDEVKGVAVVDLNVETSGFRVADDGIRNAEVQHLREVGSGGGAVAGGRQPAQDAARDQRINRHRATRVVEYSRIRGRPQIQPRSCQSIDRYQLPRGNSCRARGTCASCGVSEAAISLRGERGRGGSRKLRSLSEKFRVE